MGCRFGMALVGCAGLMVATALQGAAQAPVTINVVVTLTTMSSGAVVMTTGTTPASGTTTGSAGPSAGSTGATSSGSATTPDGGDGGTAAPTSGGLTLSSSNTPGCVSTYAQALAGLTTFGATLGQVKTIYAADHLAGAISNSAYQAGLTNLLGIGLDAGAAHDMVQIGGDAADITTQIATVQTELSAVTNVDLLALVASMQAQLAAASAAVSASSGCAVSVAQ